MSVKVLVLQKFLAMAVTKLERKGRKNKTVAKTRVATIRRLKTKNTVPSDNKEESGIVIGDVADVLADIKKPAKKAAPKAKKEEAPKAEAEVAEAAPAAEKEAEEKPAKKAAAKKPAAKKAPAKKADDSEEKEEK